MALALGFSPGDDFYIDNTRVVVTEIVGPQQYSLTLTKAGQPAATVLITDRQSVEVTPHCHISAGHSGSMETARILFEAPQSVKILRGRVYRRDQRNRNRAPERESVCAS